MSPCSVNANSRCVNSLVGTIKRQNDMCLSWKTAYRDLDLATGRMVDKETIAGKRRSSPGSTLGCSVSSVHEMVTNLPGLLVLLPVKASAAIQKSDTSLSTHLSVAIGMANSGFPRFSLQWYLSGSMSLPPLLFTFPPFSLSCVKIRIGLKQSES